MEPKTLTIIVPPNTPQASSPLDREGVEDHGLIPGLTSGVARKIDLPQFLKDVEDTFDKVRAIAERVKGRAGEFEADEIAVGLAVSAEGSVGVATAGAEVSIEITFRRIRNTSEV